MTHALPVLTNDPGPELERALAPRLRGELRTRRHDRMLYATDASIYQVEPLAVVIPRSAEDIIATLEVAAELGLPVLPRGGGTALAGQTVNRAVVIDASRHLTRVLGVDAEARTARIEPGLVLDDFNCALEPHDLMFGPDVATSTHATLGGMIGNNSAGAHSVLYGRTVEHVRRLDIALADGSILRLGPGAVGADGRRDPRVEALTERIAAIVEPIAGEIDRRFPRTRRRVDGYNLDLVLAQLRASTPGTRDAVNLAHLVVGSEGTLGVTLEAEVGLVPRPRVRGLAIAAFAGVDAALESVVPLLALQPAAVELVDDIIIDLARANREHRGAVDLLPRPGGATPKAVLYVAFFRDGVDELDAAFAALRQALPDAAVEVHRTPTSMGAAWRLRKAGEPLLHGQVGARKPVTFVEDTAVDPERLPEFVRAFRAILDRHGTHASYYAHASVGCLHIRPMIALDAADDRERMARIMEEVTDLVMEHGGALSGEHGDGRLRSHLLERFYGPVVTRAFRAVKDAFDPGGRLNPGNIVDPISFRDHWRTRPGAGEEQRAALVPNVRTYFDYERQHGFGGAVEMCNGAGICRRTQGGTMCPSYRATRDERHATRGRGNALRLAITGQTAGAVWNDPETLATLDLCLSCKACKSECPSNVDVARLKSEYLAHSYAAAGGTPRRVRAFADVRRVSRMAGIAPGVADALGRFRPFRVLLERTLGVDARRSMPPAGRPIWSSPIVREAERCDGPTVVLFADCFTAFGERSIGLAAVQVLRALGHRVVVPRSGCCGRPHISLGALPEAIATAQRTLAELDACMERESPVAVLGCEPSCVSAIVDDWPDLVDLDRGAARRLAEQTEFVEDFAARAWDGAAPAVRRPHEGPVVLHGHCHQKALGQLAPTHGLLERVCTGSVTTLSTGCCGMAGAFGMTRDHHDVSLAVAERELLPALRTHESATVVAPGASCRHQMHDLARRAARHPIEIIATALL